MSSIAANRLLILGLTPVSDSRIGFLVKALTWLMVEPNTLLKCSDPGT